MGRDKALLPMDGRTLLEHVAERVAAAAGDVTVIGAPERYRHLNLDCVADRIPGCGPLGGLVTALSLKRAEWNLVVACDMPAVTSELLASLLQAGRVDPDVDAVVPESPDGLQPLCAVYHRRVCAAAEAALHHKSLKMHDFVSSLNALRYPVANARLFANLNTPEQLAR